MQLVVISEDRFWEVVKVNIDDCYTDLDEDEEFRDNNIEWAIWKVVEKLNNEN